MALPISFRWDEGFVARVDAARGDVPRSVFVRRAVERALDGWERVEDPPVISEASAEVGRQVFERSPVSSGWAKRDVVPIPKGGR